MQRLEFICDLPNMRVDSFLAERGDMTRSAAAKLCDNGAVTIGGKPCRKKDIVSVGDEVAVELSDPVEAEAKPQDIPISVVYEDDQLLVVNKPKGMVVHPAPGNPDGTLVNALLAHCGDSLSGINGVTRPGIVHRIDKDTSGLLMVAKNDNAHLCLAEQIKEHSFERVYETVVIGNMKDDEGVIDAPIARHPVDRKRMAILSTGKPARTHYTVVERYNGFTHLRVRLETGRTHQIRVHMASLGKPVLGDGVYGNGKNRFEAENRELLSGQCLHAKVVGFDHPDGRHLTFESELPDYFKEILAKLKKTYSYE